MMRVLEREQWLPTTLERAWSFFSTPHNLLLITPRDIGFTIRGEVPDEPVREGQRITYIVRPLLGVPLTWVTHIAVAEAPKRFVDVQIKGPYRHWWHEHTFEEHDGGVLMKDRLQYEMPLGVLGEAMHAMIVRRKIEGIFEFRWRALSGIFGGQDAQFAPPAR